jgi:DNA polymerase III sliding clamp (beta) subunit (PCNA family)
MMGLDPRSFPAMPAQSAKRDDATSKEIKGELKIAAAVLAGMIDKTIFAVSPDEARYNLSGVYIEATGSGAVRMVATDGHRLSLIDRDAPGFEMKSGAIIPRKGLAELKDPSPSRRLAPKWAKRAKLSMLISMARNFRSGSMRFIFSRCWASFQPRATPSLVLAMK